VQNLLSSSLLSIHTDYDIQNDNFEEPGIDEENNEMDLQEMGFGHGLN
jgi:hypothetical protein